MLVQGHNNQYGFEKLILLLLLSGTVVLLISPVSAYSVDAGGKPVVTIVARGSQSYYFGEEVDLSGINSASDSTYLFITGPNIPEGGVTLTPPKQKPVNGDPSTFTTVITKPDKTWEYSFYTANLMMDAGTYTIYAVSKPTSRDQFDDTTTYGTVSLILKRPFITAEISPASVTRGQPFSITGIAEGIPPEVQIWIIGKNYAFTTKTPVNPDASFTFTATEAMSGNLPAGQYYLIAQHPMVNNQFDIAVSGDYVRNMKLNNGTILFRIIGPGNLQGSDAKDALVAAFSDPTAHDDTHTADTYTVIPFRVTDAGPVSGASANTGVTIAAQGDQSYYLGEKVVLSGHNYDSDTTYLFITGPGTFMNGPGIPCGGGKLTSPLQEVVSGNPDSFTVVKTKADKSWEYAFYTSNVTVDAGTYTIFAVSQPKAKDQLGPAAANVGIILKKPFITAEISSATISKGVPLTVSGVAEGIPSNVQIWILGKNYYSKSIVSVNSDASYKYVVLQEVTSHFASGQYFVIVQHPMENTTFDIDVSGDYVRSLQLNNGTDLFRISGPGSLQGNDAAEALVAAFSDPNNGDDTYTEIPFQVTDAGSPTPQATATTTAPVQRTTQHAPLHYAQLGAIVVAAGIVIRKRR
ncbi:MAG: hypothetical protein ABSB80_02935 [Methanoregula sp.]|jgi:hypothetical protein|uniref:hypothetical protein n=1 Tax=Methanoregula sp. TaxID=2052170 RepID=UPI003D14D33F